MLPRKFKPEGRALPAWLNALIGPVSFDFVAPHPLEEVLRVLKTQPQSRLGRIDPTPVDADTFAFSMKKRESRYTTLEGHGYFKRWDRNTTHVTGRLNVTSNQYWLFLMMAFFVVLLLFVELETPVWLILLLFDLVMWGYTRQHLHEVAHLIERTLDVDLSDDDSVK